MLKHGIELFLQNRFKDAKKVFESVVVDQLSTDDRVSLYHYLLTIYKSLGETTAFKHRSLQYFDFLLSQRQYKELHSEITEFLHREFCCNLNNLDELAMIETQYLSKGWKASVELGFIQDGKSYSNAMLLRFLSTRNFSAILEHLEERKKTVGESLFTKEVELFAYLFKGDVAGFDNTLRGALDQKLKGSKEWSEQIVKKLGDHGHLRAILSESVEYGLLRLESKKSIETLEDRKLFANILYQLIIKIPDDPRVFRQILHYAIHCSSKRIATQVRQVIVTNPELTRSKKIRDELNHLIEKSNSIEESEDENFEIDDNFDFATDLFSSDEFHSLEGGREARGFEFLKSIGADDLAQDVKERLLLKQKNEAKDWIDFGRISKIESEAVASDLMKELDYFSKLYCKTADVKEENLTDDSSVASYIRHGGLEIDDERCIDIAIALKEMGLHTSALEILNQAKALPIFKDNLERKIELRYLMIEVLSGLNKFGDALALLEEMLNTWALMDQEKLCFSYMAGEIYRKLGDKGRALNWYLVANSIDQDYRMLKERLNEFE